MCNSNNFIMYMCICLYIKLSFISFYYLLASIDPSKTVFLHQSNTIVVTCGIYYSMQIIPKDKFGNPANVCQQFLTAEIRKVSPLFVCVLYFMFYFLFSFSPSTHFPPLFLLSLFLPPPPRVVQLVYLLIQSV